MALSYELISQFAKLATSNTKSNNGTTVYGNVGVDDDGNKYVVPDGSNQKIPINPTGDTVTSVENGNRVSVLIKDHTAIVTGNISSPSATVEKVQANEAYFKRLIADELLLGKLEAAEVSIAELIAKEADIDKLITDKATITDLIAKKIDANVVDADYAKIKDLEAVGINVAELIAQKAEIGDLVAENAKVKELFAQKAEIGDLVSENAKVKELFAQKAEIGDLVSENAKVKELFVEKASVEDLIADSATIKNLNAKYADIDFSNIKMAAVEALFTKSGIIDHLTVGDTSITGELVGVTITGDLIKANTLMAEQLVVRGSDGNLYKLNTDFSKLEGVELVQETAVHGSTIAAKSITAEKVSVNDLVAFGAKIGGFTITGSPDGSGGAIYSGAKGSVNADAIQGIYMDSTGQLALGDEHSFLKYYYDEKDGKYKLEVAADQFKLSSGKTLEESVTDKLEIGARNLIRNSKTMIFEDYYFETEPSTDDEAVLDAIIADQEAILAEQEVYMGVGSDTVNVDSTADTVEEVLDETLAAQTEIIERMNTILGGVSE